MHREGVVSQTKRLVTRRPGEPPGPSQDTAREPPLSPPPPPTVRFPDAHEAGLEPAGSSAKKHSHLLGPESTFGRSRGQSRGQSRGWSRSQCPQAEQSPVSWRTGRRAGRGLQFSLSDPQDPTFSGPHCRADSSYCTRSRMGCFPPERTTWERTRRCGGRIPTAGARVRWTAQSWWIWVFPLNRTARSGGMGFSSTEQPAVPQPGYVPPPALLTRATQGPSRAQGPARWQQRLGFLRSAYMHRET